MPVEKIAFRLPPRDLCRPDDGTFQTHYEARVDRPLATIDLSDVFLDVGLGRLEPGDQITFCAFEGSMLARERVLREIGVCRIVAKMTENGRPKIKAEWIGEFHKIDAANLPDAKPQTVKLEIKGEFEGDFTVRDVAGNVIERVNTKDEAEAFVAAYGDGKRKPGRPPKEAAKEAKAGAPAAA